MSDPCDIADGWDEKTRDERFEALKEFTKDLMTDLGYGDVNVTMGPDEHDYGSWHFDTNTINFNEDAVADKSAEENVDTAFHEATHAIDDKVNGSPVDLGEDMYLEKGTIIFDDDGTPVLWERGTYLSPEHQAVEDFADDVTDMALDDCDDEDEVESGSDADMPKGDWNVSDYTEAAHA